MKIAEELKLKTFLAGRLPDKIHYHEIANGLSFAWTLQPHEEQYKVRHIRYTEWPAIVAMVEEQLDGDQIVSYVQSLAKLHPTFCIEFLDPRYEKDDWKFEISKLITASWQTRGMALMAVLVKDA